MSCSRCGASYPTVGGIPCLLPAPDEWVATWKRQLAMFQEQVDETARRLAEERDRPGLLPTSYRRLKTMLDASNDLRDQIGALLAPLLATFPDPQVAPGEREVRALTFYIDLLYRDWAWETSEPGEIASALTIVSGVAGDAPLGRMLVLGAGGCRLPYELHKLRGEETFVLDVDILLFAAAARVVAGETIELVEAPVQVDDIEAVAVRRALVAPRGPIDGTFHFMFANALAPPFAPAGFDTILTPWFVDVASPDLRDLIGTIDRLLVPGGRWIHFGPFAYSSKVPAGCRFTAQEVLELAAESGFRIDASRIDTARYTYSPLNHRGRLERTLAFSASKTPGHRETRDHGSGPPAWIVLPHLPVPLAAPTEHDDPLSLAIWDGVDGARSIHDIAGLLMPRLGMPLSDVQDAVRECLLSTHPEARKPSIDGARESGKMA